MEIKLEKRLKYAGDVLNALMEKYGWDMETAITFLGSIPDANAEERKALRKAHADLAALEADFKAFALSVWEEDKRFPCLFCKQALPDGQCTWKKEHRKDPDGCFSKHFEWQGRKEK